MAAFKLSVLDRTTVVILLVLLVHCSLSLSAPNCSTGFPEEPENTTQFLTNGNGSIWTGLQVVIPEMKFTCSGTITAWTGWFTLNQNFAIVQSVRMQVWRPSCTEEQELTLIGSNLISVQHHENITFYEEHQEISEQHRVTFQPGDVIGFQVLIPMSSVQPATPLISRNSSSMTMYYKTFTQQPPSKLSLCDPKVGMLKGIQPQVSPIFEVSDQTQQPPCAGFLLSSCFPRSTPVDVTPTAESATPTPSPTALSGFPVAGLAAGISVAVVVLLAVVLGVAIVSILVCVTRLRHAKTRSQDIQHYEAKTGEIYTVPRSRSGCSVINNDSTFIPNGGAGGDLRENWTDNTSRDEDTPPPPPPPFPPLLTRFSSVSSSISMLSPQQKVFPMQRMNQSALTLASPYMLPQTSPTKLMFRSRSTTLPRLDSQRPSSGKQSGSSPLKQPRKHSFPYNTSPKKSPPIQPIPYKTSMAGIPLAEEPDSSYPLCNQQFDNDHQAQHYMEPLKLREPPSQAQEAFPYADPVSISPMKETVDSPRTAIMQGKYSSLPYQRSGAYAEETLASPYMDPSPVMRTKHHSGDHTFRETTGTESTSGSHGMFYIPHDDLNQIDSPTFDLGPDCFHVPNYRQRKELEAEEFNENIYSKLERRNDCQAQSYPSNEFEMSPQFWRPPSTSEELYDQLSAKDYREIPRKKIGITDNIGSGHFGTVSKGVWQIKGGHMEVAVKALKPDAPEDEEVKFLQEAAIMGQFYHSNIVKLHGVVTLGKPLMIVLELMPRGDMKHFLKRQRRLISDLNKRDLAKLFLKFCRDIASGMNYLAEKKYVHRDLAARNILLSDDLTCKIGDFGMARDLTIDVAESCGGKIPLKWTAPEAVQCRRYTTASDVWSYGMVLYEIWTLGKKPFEKMDIKTLLSVIGTGYCHSPPPGCPRSIYHLMVKCWHPYPNMRPRFSEIFAELSCLDDSLLWWSPQDEMVSARCTELGAPLEEGQNLYLDLQIVYKMEDIMSP